MPTASVPIPNPMWKREHHPVLRTSEPPSRRHKKIFGLRLKPSIKTKKGLYDCMLNRSKYARRSRKKEKRLERLSI